MKTRRAHSNFGVPGTPAELVGRLLWLGGMIVFAAALVFSANAASRFGHQPAVPQNPSSSAIPNVKCVIGLEDIKPGARGELASLPSGLEFSTEKKKVDVATSSIQDVFTGQESRQDVGGMGGTLVEAAIPYGGGRVVSLFSHKVDVLTVEYADSNGGFHGAIFVVPAGKAAAFKDQLVAQGARVSKHVESPEAKEPKP